MVKDTILYSKSLNTEINYYNYCRVVPVALFVNGRHSPPMTPHQPDYLHLGDKPLKQTAKTFSKQRKPTHNRANLLEQGGCHGACLDCGMSRRIQSRGAWG